MLNHFLSFASFIPNRVLEGHMVRGKLEEWKGPNKKTVRRVDKSRLYRRSKVNKEGLKFYRLKTKEVIRHWTLGIRTCLDRNDGEECFGETKTWSRGKTEQQQTSRTTAWYQHHRDREKATSRRQAGMGGNHADYCEGKTFEDIWLVPTRTIERRYVIEKSREKAAKA